MSQAYRSRPLFALSVIVLLSLVLAACGTPAAAPTTAPAAAPAATAAPVAAEPAATAAPAAVSEPAAAGKYAEAPMLAELVQAGELPPVEERLPENPLVVPAESIGQYGGVWRRGFLGPADMNSYARVVYDSLARATADGNTLVPKVAESIEPNADNTVWTVKLRKGARWSDGDPMDADDIMFWWNDVYQSTDLNVYFFTGLKNIDGSFPTVEKVDDYTVTFTFKEGQSNFLMDISNVDGSDRMYAAFLPSHYLKQFHPNYTAQADLDKMAKDAGYDTWVQLFASKNAPPENPERPTMAAWVPATRISEKIFTLKRNPYYIGVDTAGNQLPYLDEVRFTFFQDANALNLAAVAGEFDLQERTISLANYTVLKENEAAGKYNVYTWNSFGGVDCGLIFNPTYRGDPEIAELLQTRDFRVALSQAINRSEIQESAFLGLGEARQDVPAPTSRFYPGDEVAYRFTEQDVEAANKLLDGIGLDQKNAEGIRLTKSGKPVTVEISVVPMYGTWTDATQLIAKDWEAVGVKGIVQVRERATHFQMRASDDLMIEVWMDDFTSNPLGMSFAVYPQRAQNVAWRTWYYTNGEQGTEPPDDQKEDLAKYLGARALPAAESEQAMKEVYANYVDQMYMIGIVGMSPMINGVAVVNKNLKNVPVNLAGDMPIRAPGNAWTETFYFDNAK